MWITNSKHSEFNEQTIRQMTYSKPLICSNLYLKDSSKYSVYSENAEWEERTITKFCGKTVQRVTNQQKT